MNERKKKGLTYLNFDEKSLGKLVCPWPECIFRSLLQFLVILVYPGVSQLSTHFIVLIHAFPTGTGMTPDGYFEYSR